MSLPIRLAERGCLPDSVIRFGIRRLLAQRLKQCRQSPQAILTDLQKPIAVATDQANEQHYEVEPAFFELVLGPRRKYSCCWYTTPETPIDIAEEAMLRQTCEHAGLEDGMDILELGCGWGSLTLWMAERYPSSHITAISNSRPQRETIEALARERGLINVTVKTADINRFRPDALFDRIVSVEMFEHVRNHVVLLERIAQWLKPEGKLFVHIFCHDQFAYTYENQGESDWMARHFFSGGMMPSFNYFKSLPVPFTVEQAWPVNGTHYARTCRDWLRRLDEHRGAVEAILRKDLSPVEAALQAQRWRIFFMACEELFAWNRGKEWYVGHYLMAPKVKVMRESAPRHGGGHLMFHALLLLALASTATVTEPNTQVTFEATMVVGEQTLHLTGVDRRRALGRDAYAVAHYTAGMPETAQDPDARLARYIDAPANKVLVFHGVYKSVPAHGIRLSWKKHFKDLDMTPREDFIEAFQAPFARGERLYFIASPEGGLEARHDEKVIGQWNDPALVRALWAMCLGPTTEIVDRMKLAALNPAPEEIAVRETEKETPRP